MNKKQMYNRIMESVAREVKKALNEGLSMNSYQDQMDQIMSKGVENLTKKDIWNCIDLYKEYGVQYNPHLDGNYFKSFISNIIDICGDDVNLNWIDTSEVNNMSYIFSYSRFNGDISNWDVSRVTNMSFMFSNSSFNGDLSRWDVSNVQDIRNMFYRCLIREEYKPQLPE